MKVTIKYIFLFMISVSSFRAQDTIIKYIDEKGNETSIKLMADHYVKLFKGDNKMWVMNSYYMSGHRLAQGFYTSKKMDVREGHFIYYYESGGKKSEGECVNDKYEGEWQFWHENGKKWAIGSYANSDRVDAWRHWYENGNIESDEVYQVGILYVGTYYHENGTKRSQGHFSDRKKTGVWTFWNVDGKPYLKGAYEGGRQVGEWTRFFENGENMLLHYTNGVLQEAHLGQVIRIE